MKLHLEYEPFAKQTYAGFFVRGNQIEPCLKSIQQLEHSVSTLSIFPVPHSMQDGSLTGFFVRLAESQNGKVFPRNPYKSLCESLYIPTNAKLAPAYLESELKKLLVYDCHFFHPTIGLVGFNESDALQLESVLRLERIEKNWDLMPSLPIPNKRLRSMKIAMDSDERIMEKLIDTQKKKPLDQIKASDPEMSLLRRWMLTVFKPLLEFLARKEDKSKKPTPGKGLASSSGSVEGSVSSLNQLLNSLQNWSKEQLDQLKKQRQSEVERLMKLFDEDVEEALKYALPINNKFQGRGIAPPSGRLSKNPGIFNLGRLGGGGAVDGWDIGDYANNLRIKYFAAARKALEKKDFKKAAYIYAHLLGDFHSAANALEQGDFYFEAAQLHLLHLANPGEAAACYERGGMLVEAIEQYQKLANYEKVGKLYARLADSEQSEKFYRKAVEQHWKAGSPVKAAEICTSKINDLDLAQEIFEDGWRKLISPRECITGLLDLTKETTATCSKMRELCKPANRHGERSTHLCQALVSYLQVQQDQDVISLCKDLCYEMISEQLCKKQDHSSLHLLTKLQSQDQIISADVARYKYMHESPPQIQAAGINCISQFELDRETVWVRLLNYHGQYLCFGYKANQLNMLRANLNGDLEYYAWATKLSNEGPINVCVAPSGNTVFLYADQELPLIPLSLESSNAFPAPLKIQCANWVPPDAIGVAASNSQELLVLHKVDEQLCFSSYSLAGELQANLACETEYGEGINLSGWMENTGLTKRGEYWYFHAGNYIMRVDEQGVVEGIDHGSKIQELSFAPAHSAKRIFVSSPLGIHLYRPSRGSLDEDSTRLCPNDYAADSILFVPDKYLLLVEDAVIFVFKVENGKAALIEELNMAADVVQLIAMQRRNHFAVLLEDGKLLYYRIS